MGITINNSYSITIFTLRKNVMFGQLGRIQSDLCTFRQTRRETLEHFF